ncbi:TadE/TadG family type IV pilus assembly protein [Massilia sp. NR 4-1]|uniref:TadE/TadG family type IV pilus assembly protein n=1 Tax=Massilia sp. NR 4-1 TaxID=1678028 RepID=UPI0006A2AE2E|nr:TadE/TadG family type IV pilus assembly protein [Massilia sp. NR 4-1]AKU20341.1 hypothetical protein ACZ75_01135 [Massilia sp. NR 4-1]
MRTKLRKPGSPPQQQGAAAVEFGIIVALYIFILLCIVELGLLFFVNLTLQHAVREGARYAITGQRNADPNTANQQRYLAIVQQIRNASMGYFDPVVKNIVITVNNGTPTAYDKSSAYVPGMFGAAGDIVVFRLDCNWSLMTPFWKGQFTGGVYAFSVAATMRNEAF